MNRRLFVGFSLAAAGGIFVPQYGQWYHHGSGVRVLGQPLEPGEACWASTHWVDGVKQTNTLNARPIFSDRELASMYIMRSPDGRFDFHQYWLRTPRSSKWHRHEWLVRRAG